MADQLDEIDTASVRTGWLTPAAPDDLAWLGKLGDFFIKECLRSNISARNLRRNRQRMNARFRKRELRRLAASAAAGRAAGPGDPSLADIAGPEPDLMVAIWEAARK
jgi:hypothetical protein